MHSTVGSEDLAVETPQELDTKNMSIPEMLEEIEKVLAFKRCTVSITLPSKRNPKYRAVITPDVMCTFGVVLGYLEVKTYTMVDEDPEMLLKRAQRFRSAQKKVERHVRPIVLDSEAESRRKPQRNVRGRRRKH